MLFSPTISAFILTYMKAGKAGVQTLLKRYVHIRLGWKWYLGATTLLIVPAAITFVLNIIHVGNGTGISSEATVPYVSVMMIYTFLSGPFSEEAGWRGYLLPRLQAKFNTLLSSLIVGIVWVLWHVPLAFVEGTNQSLFGVVGWIIYAVLIVSLSLILSWLYNNTKGSLLLVIIGHFCFNLSSMMIVYTLGFVDYTTYSIVGGIAGTAYLLIIFLGFGYRRFSKLPDSELPIS